MVKQCAMCLEYQQTQPKEKALHYEIPCRPWEVAGADVSKINGKTLLCIVHYHSKVPILNKINSLSVDNLAQMTKLIFAEYRLLKKTVSDTFTNFTAETFKRLLQEDEHQQTNTSTHHHQSNRQVDICRAYH